MVVAGVLCAERKMIVFAATRKTPPPSLGLQFFRGGVGFARPLALDITLCIPNRVL